MRWPRLTPTGQSLYLLGFGQKRHDEIFDGLAQLRYPLTDWLEVSIHGRYIHNESNTQTFDFDRWIAGGKLTLTWNGTLD